MIKEFKVGVSSQANVRGGDVRTSITAFGTVSSSKLGSGELVIQESKAST